MIWLTIYLIGLFVLAVSSGFFKLHNDGEDAIWTCFIWPVSLLLFIFIFTPFLMAHGLIIVFKSISKIGEYLRNKYVK